jgi:phosphoglycolate phosphatase
MHSIDTKKAPGAMIFDLDGTLFKTETLLLPAYHAMFDQLRAEGLFEGPTPPEERILGGLGMLLEQIWERVMPEASEAAHRRADALLLQQETDRLAAGEGELYEEVRETLEQLHARGIRLFVASNGLEDYVKGVPAAKGIAHLFEGLYSAGEYQTRTKVDLVRLLLDKHSVPPDSAWMVGDRSSDVEAGLENGLFVVGCDYAGFGKDAELNGSHVRIQAFSDIIALL